MMTLKRRAVRFEVEEMEELEALARAEHLNFSDLSAGQSVIFLERARPSLGPRGKFSEIKKLGA